MKSGSDPCISDATARKNATPSTIPDSETMLWRGRASRCFSAIAGARPSITAPRPRMGALVARPVSPGVGDATIRSFSRKPGEDLDLARILGADRDLLLFQLSVDDAPHRILLHRAGRHEQRVIGLAQDDVGLGRHADHQRRVLRQRDADPVGARDGVALRRDRLHRAAENLPRKRIGADQHLLAGTDLRDILLVDLGRDAQRRAARHPENRLVGTDDLSDFAVTADDPAVGRRDQIEIPGFGFGALAERLGLLPIGASALS